MYLFSDTDERLISPGMGEEARHRGNVYCNLKTIGRVYSTAMACPPCCPGSHLGIVLTTRIASAQATEICYAILLYWICFRLYRQSFVG